jgi:hypothetical protein
MIQGSNIGVAATTAAVHGPPAYPSGPDPALLGETERLNLNLIYFFSVCDKLYPTPGKGAVNARTIPFIQNLRRS